MDRKIMGSTSLTPDPARVAGAPAIAAPPSVGAPVRIQLRRAKGWRLQDASRAINGLPAVNVARPSRWGNPYRIGTCLIGNAKAAVMAFSANLPLSLDVSELRGRNLACWCPTDAPHCHADVLLKLASDPTP